MEVLTLDELQDLCRRRGLDSRGTKASLIERLVLSSIATNDSSTHTHSAAARARDEARFGLETKNYDTMSVPELKDLCRRRSLPVGGIKKDIVARLKARDQSETLAVRDAAVAKAASTESRSSKTRLRLEHFMEEYGKKEAPRRTLLLHEPNAASGSNRGPVATKVISTPSKPPSKPTASTHVSHKGTGRQLAFPFTLSASKTSEVAAVGKKRKISTSSGTETGVSPSPNKVRKNESFFARPTAASPKKMVQLSQAQYLAKQKPATRTLQQYLDELSSKLSAAKQSLSEFVSATKIATATTVLSPKPNIFIVYSTKPSSTCELVKAFKSLPEANARVRQEFYENHPEGGSVDNVELLTNAVEVKYENELLTLAMRPPHKTWTVGAVAVAVGSSKVFEMEECFVVSSHLSKMTEAPDSTPTTKLHQVCANESDANAYATTVFDDKNPWELTRDQITKEGGVRRCVNGGMLSLSKKGRGGAVWTVSVRAVGLADAPRNKKLLEPVMMSPPKPSKRKALTSFFPAGNPSTSRSSATASNPSNQKVSKPRCFVVYSSHIFREERRGKRKEPEYEFYPPIKTKEEATALAEAVFYTLNPWGWTMSQFTDKGVQKTFDTDHHMKMSVLETDTWEVCVAVVRTSTHVAEADPASGILVYTVRGNELPTQERPQDPKVKVETILQPHEVNGLRIEELFCECNPHKWDREHFKDSKITKTFEDGMFTVSAKPAASKASWVMKCTPFTRKTVPENTPEDTASPPRAALETRVKVES